ncbi:MAG: hypothetical protein CMH57_02065 [Myxococcales bacterium]|nr:hypothetical protein [Myxococcales bacterium]
MTMNIETIKPNVELDLQSEAEMMADAIMDELDFEELEQEIANADACVITTGNRYDDISTENFNREKVARLRRLVADGEYKPDARAVAAALLDSGHLMPSKAE